MEVGLLRVASAPIDPGVQLGEVRWRLDGKVIAQMPLVSRGSAWLDVREPLSFWGKVRLLFGGEADE